MAVDRTDIETGRLLSAIVTWPEAQLTEHGTAGSVAPVAPKSKPPEHGAGNPATNPRCPWRGFPLGLAGPPAWEQGARFRHKSVMGRPTRKAARMSEWVLHCEVKQRHIRRSQPTRDAALKDACSQLLQGYSVNRIVGPNETITAERIKSWCASRGFPQEPLWRRHVSQAEPS
jgi:hypothetical protein